MSADLLARLRDERLNQSLADERELADLLQEAIDALSAVPREAISWLVTWTSDEAVRNGANSASMPDEIVTVAAWLAGVSTKR